MKGNHPTQASSLRHRRILQAIEAGDADSARLRAERDLQAYAKHLEAAVSAARRKAVRR